MQRYLPAFLIVFLNTLCISYGQSPVTPLQLINFIAGADSAAKTLQAEKVYLQMDKTNYAIGDTIWFKSYLFNAYTLSLSSQSRLLYIDITDKNSSVVKRYKTLVKNGLSWGSIDVADFSPGSYTLRAYTNWMRNFDPGGFFYNNFVVQGEPETTADTNGPTVFVTKKPPKVKHINAPVKAIKSIDLQFLPESGSMIAGIPARVGFKTIDESGRGVDVSGTLLDDNNKQIGSFASTHLGMGSFEIPNITGTRYKARLAVPGHAKDYWLAPSNVSGTVLRIDNDFEKDSVAVTVSATKDIATSGHHYFLIAKARNITCYAAEFAFLNGRQIKRNVAKNLFPIGITHFIVTDAAGKLLNERLIFIDHNDVLQIQIKTNKAFYAPKDSVGISLAVSNSFGQRLPGSFSVAVTDDGQVSIDSLKGNIFTYILLSSDLKGIVEQPGYYYRRNARSYKDLDDLLLTQGWISYEPIMGGGHLSYSAETDDVISGKVVNGAHKPMSGVKVTLISRMPLFVRDTMTNNAGQFSFSNIPEIITPVYIIKATGPHNKDLSGGIIMDEPLPPPLTTPVRMEAIGQPVDSTLLMMAKNSRLRREQKYLDPAGRLLKEVIIKAKKIIRNSQNLNGPGNADVVISENDLVNAGKKNWYEMLNQKVRGFREGSYIGRTVDRIKLWSFLNGINDVPANFSVSGTLNSLWYFVEDKPVKFLIDGIALGALGTNFGFRDIEHYLKTHFADDLKGIEINLSSRYSAAYVRAAPISPSDICIIEITTRYGHGPYYGNSSGIYVYRPLAISSPRQFYKPRYLPTDTARHLPDLRSTLYWEPNIITDKNGNASFSFYAADKAGTYTLIIEGTDGEGNLGYEIKKINIGKPQNTKN